MGAGGSAHALAPARAVVSEMNDEAWNGVDARKAQKPGLPVCAAIMEMPSTLSLLASYEARIRDCAFDHREPTCTYLSPSSSQLDRVAALRAAVAPLPAGLHRLAGTWEHGVCWMLDPDPLARPHQGCMPAASW